MLLSAYACISLCLLNFAISLESILRGYGAFSLPLQGLIICANEISTLYFGPKPTLSKWPNECYFRNHMFVLGLDV